MNSIESIVKRLQESRIAEDNDYVKLKRAYKNATSFEDMEKESGNIKDLTDELDRKGIDYDIYKDKTTKGCTVFHDSSEPYLSSLNKEVMRAVNSEAPKAMSWRDGDTIKNTKTGQRAKFRGYQKDFSGKYKAILLGEDPDEEIKYTLSDLNKDIEGNVLVRETRKSVEESKYGPMIQDDDSLQAYLDEPLKVLLSDLDSKIRLRLDCEYPTHYGSNGFFGRSNQVTWEYADLIIKEIAVPSDKYTDIEIVLK